MNSLFLKIALWEKGLFFFINHNIKNRLFDIIFPFISRLGEEIPLLIIFIIIFLIGKRKAKITTIVAAMAIVISRLSVQILKHIFNRPRPFYVYNDINIFINTPTASFPSGHSTLVFAVATVLSFKYNGLSWLFITCATLVGLSRIYMGLHYPFDVLAGAILGAIVGRGIIYLENKISQLKQK